MSKIIDLTGQRFNRLVVLKQAGLHKKRRALWECKCDCGNVVLVPSNSLRSGNTQSCGCLKKEVGLANILKPRRRWNTKPKGEAAFHEVYQCYIINANSRNLTFKLTEDFFRQLICQPCYYCGSKFSNNKSRKRLNGSFTYNGLDRIDNSAGYTTDNVVPCCWLCNRMKQSMSIDDFLSHIEKIQKHIQEKLSLTTAIMKTVG